MRTGVCTERCRLLTARTIRRQHGEVDDQWVRKRVGQGGNAVVRRQEASCRTLVHNLRKQEGIVSRQDRVDEQWTIRHLNERVVEEGLGVRVLEVLAPNNVCLLPAPARKLRLDMNRARRGDSDVHVPVVAHVPRRRRLRERRRIVARDLARRARRRREVGHDLEAAGHEPVLIDRVVGLGRDDVEGDVVRLAVGQHGHERR